MAQLIVLEGLDATGKSTLAARLAHALDAELMRTPPADLATVRPTLDASFTESPVATQLLYAATVKLVSDRAREVLRQGRSVVVDRYWFSTCAYAQCRASHLDLSAIEAALAKPDVTFFLDLDEPTRDARMSARGATAADLASLTQARSLRRAYESLLAGTFGGRVVRIDTSSLTQEACLAAALQALDTRKAA